MSTYYERILELHGQSPVFDPSTMPDVIPNRPFLQGLDARLTTRGRPVFRRLRTIEGGVLLAPAFQDAGIYLVRLWHDDLLTTALVPGSSAEHAVDLTTGACQEFGLDVNTALVNQAGGV